MIRVQTKESLSRRERPPLPARELSSGGGDPEGKRLPLERPLLREALWGAGAGRAISAAGRGAACCRQGAADRVSAAGGSGMCSVNRFGSALLDRGAAAPTVVLKSIPRAAAWRLS